MGRNISDTGMARVAFDNQPEALTSETLSMMVQEQCLFVGMARGQLGAHIVQIIAISVQ